MPGFKGLVNLWLLAVAIALLVVPRQADAAFTALDGASPGERETILAYCGDSRGVIAHDMCMSNQIVGLLRLGRKPDLSVASSSQQEEVATACSGKPVPAERFACERKQLGSFGLPVRDEPGGGNLKITTGSPRIASQDLPALGQTSDSPAFNLNPLRGERPPMRPAREGARLAPPELYRKIAPSIYIVIASDHAVELAERTPHAQGSAVAISDDILLTNCHIVAARPQILLSQQGKTGRATLVYADPASDRCFLKSETLELRPIQGVRRFSDLHVGEAVFSIGTPAGFEESFGQGIISGLRQLGGVNVVQNSAPTGHGSSGGGLFDTRGNLIGITTAVSSKVPNLNFSIAAEDFFSR